MTLRSKYRWALIAMLVLVGGMWGGIAAAGIKPRLGLDLQGGISVVLAPKAGARSDSLDQAVNIIRDRVDALGVAEPDISRQGSNILVQLPGIKEQSRALSLIGTTAQLRFRPVIELILPSDPRFATLGPKSCANRNTFPPDVPGKEIVL